MIRLLCLTMLLVPGNNFMDVGDVKERGERFSVPQHDDQNTQHVMKEPS